MLTFNFLRSWGIDEAIVKGQKEEMYRRMVASPEPKYILEIKAIKKLIEADAVVITCGGGGKKKLLKSAKNFKKNVTFLYYYSIYKYIFFNFVE